jgi:AraC family transcriptional regulator
MPSSRRGVGWPSGDALSGNEPRHDDFEIGFPLAASVAGNGGVECGTLSGGAVVFGVHEGAYSDLGQSYTALEKWMEANGAKAAGAPWESYITDPAEHPNPADWRTEIYWPVEDR